ncbi:MAG: sugar MFS transporter [Muribaculum sp.]|nr:sugar MFS transporter [Muribaculum sp.]
METTVSKRSGTMSLVKKEYLIPFILVTSLFFMWGFARSILDVLNKHFQADYGVSIGQSAMIQATTYVGYFLMAIPAGLFINKWGYRKGVVLGLLFFGIGSLLFIPSEHFMSFNSFLISLFVIGCGLVVIETAANPYVTELGSRETAASRLNLSQSFNGLGCILGPAIVGSLLFTSQGKEAVPVAVPYSAMGIVVLLGALVFCRVKLPEITADETNASAETSGNIMKRLIRNKGFMLGLFALFCYEIAEISINSFFINYVTDDGWMTPRTASLLLAFGGLGLFMMCRVLGSWIMSKVAAERVLLFCAFMTVIGAALIAANLGTLSKAGLFVCYAFEAIMFPTIFSICIRGLGTSTKIASSFLMMTPLGGAVGTLSMGILADMTSMSTAFLIPTLGYFVVLIYSFMVVRRRI